MRINGRYKLGVMVSVIWFVGAFLFSLGQQEQIVRDFCNQITVMPEQALQCVKAAAGDESLTHEQLGVAAKQALVPIPFAWLFVWIGVALYRWVQRGARESS